MMKTLDEIAEAWAAKAFTLMEWRDDDGGCWLGMFNGGTCTGEMIRERAEDWLACQRGDLARNYILPALREALAPPPGGSGMSDERLAHIEQMARRRVGIQRAADVVLELHAELLRERRLTAFLMRAEEGEAYAQGHDDGERAGFVRGAEAQKRACVAAAKGEFVRWGGRSPGSAEARVMRAVEETPMEVPEG